MQYYFRHSFENYYNIEMIILSISVGVECQQLNVTESRWFRVKLPFIWKELVGVLRLCPHWSVFNHSTLYLPSVTPKAWLSRLWIENCHLTPTHAWVPISHAWWSLSHYSLNWLILKKIKYLNKLKPMPENNEIVLSQNLRFITESHWRHGHTRLLAVYLTIRLWARDFYRVIVDEAEGRINYHA